MTATAMPVPTRMPMELCGARGSGPGRPGSPGRGRGRRGAGGPPPVGPCRVVVRRHGGGPAGPRWRRDSRRDPVAAAATATAASDPESAVPPPPVDAAASAAESAARSAAAVGGGQAGDATPLAAHAGHVGHRRPRRLGRQGDLGHRVDVLGPLGPQSGREQPAPPGPTEAGRSRGTGRLGRTAPRPPSFVEARGRNRGPTPPSWTMVGGGSGGRSGRAEAAAATAAPLTADRRARLPPGCRRPGRGPGDRALPRAGRRRHHLGGLGDGVDRGRRLAGRLRGHPSDRAGGVGGAGIEVELPGPPGGIGAVGLVERPQGHLVVAEHGRLELLVVGDPVGVLLPPARGHDPRPELSSPPSRASTAGTWPVGGSVQWGSSVGGADPPAPPSGPAGPDLTAGPASPGSPGSSVSMDRGLVERDRSRGGARARPPRRPRSVTSRTTGSSAGDLAGRLGAHDPHPIGGRAGALGASRGGRSGSPHPLARLGRRPRRLFLPSTGPDRRRPDVRSRGAPALCGPAAGRWRPPGLG